ncbi:MAG: DEAD/DEAH box helicase [Desulfobulbaceae bacterium]|jgi:superfamily II DNA/RNA helicase|nr:DEAD/DEAH box helicase [Desulfobulbaceae bacterium]
MSFSDFNFNTHISKAIQDCGYTAPTPIQKQAIIPILERRDLLGLAQTGTGKTAAFILPTVQHLMETSGKQVRVLIVAPTRELAEQINDFTKTIIQGTRLRSMAIYGGVSKLAQITRIRNGVDIVVACPGRLLDILNDKAINLSHVETLILDEADHMFDKGFLPDIRRILRQIPKERQSLVFSATMPGEIRHLAEDILTNPVTVQINHTRSVKSISHQVYAVEQGQKTELLVHLLKLDHIETTLVFTRTKFKAKNLALKLSQAGFKATSLQGNLSQNKRQEALEGFKDGTFKILVATDIAARGIDVTGISHVINYDMPDTAEAYIHRTGRTGRAACTGEALTFATTEDNRMVRTIEQSLEGKMQRQPVDPAVLASRHAEPDTRSNERRRMPVGNKAKTASGTQRPRNRSAASGVFGFSGRTK